MINYLKIGGSTQKKLNKYLLDSFNLLQEFPSTCIQGHQLAHCFINKLVNF
jgi:hypothetical protein